MTIDEIIKEIDSKASGRTRWEGQEPRWDEALVAEIRSLRKSLTTIALEHEDQAQAWGGEEGDIDNSQYHAKWAKFARAAIEGEPDGN